MAIILHSRQRIIIVIVDVDDDGSRFILKTLWERSRVEKEIFSIKNTKSSENKNLMDDKKDTKQHQALSYRSVEQSEADNNKTVYENCFNWIELCMTYVSSLAIMNRRLAMKKLNENTWCIGLAPLEGLVRSSRRAVMWVSLSPFFIFKGGFLDFLHKQ